MEYEDADDQVADEVKAGSFYTTPNGFNTSFSFFREDEKNYHKRLFGACFRRKCHFSRADCKSSQR